jgi:hypothetical protein
MKLVEKIWGNGQWLKLESWLLLFVCLAPSSEIRCCKARRKDPAGSSRDPEDLGTVSDFLLMCCFPSTSFTFFYCIILYNM